MSCLFDSLEYFLHIPSNKIRSEICDYLSEDNQLFDGMSTIDLLLLESKNYIQEMRKDNTWGSAIEIKSACNIWNIKIIIIDIRKIEKKNQIKFIPFNGINLLTKKIKLTWNGFHYEPVKNNDKTIKNNPIIMSGKKKYEIINNKEKKQKLSNNNDLFDIIFGPDKKLTNKNDKNDKKNKNRKK